jgi:predicted nucleic acid-binding protein
MRIVVDTNVIVSALVFGGLPRRVFEAGVSTLVDFTSPKDHAKVDYVPEIARPPLAAFLLARSETPTNDKSTAKRKKRGQAREKTSRDEH